MSMAAENPAGESAAAVLRREVPRIGVADVVRHGGTHRSGACDPTDQPVYLNELSRRSPISSRPGHVKGHERADEELGR